MFRASRFLLKVDLMIFLAIILSFDNVNQSVAVFENPHVLPEYLTA